MLLRSQSSISEATKACLSVSTACRCTSYELVPCWSAQTPVTDAPACTSTAALFKTAACLLHPGQSLTLLPHPCCHSSATGTQPALTRTAMRAQGMDGATFASATGAVLAIRGVTDHAEQESILQLRDQLLLEPAACIKHLSGSFLVGSPRLPASKGPTQDDITAGESFTIPAVQQVHRAPGGTGMTLAGTAAAGRRSSSPAAGPHEPADSSKAVMQAPGPPAPLVSAASAGGDVLVPLPPRLDVGLQGMAARVRYWSVSGMIPEYDGREAIPVVVQVEGGTFKRCAAAAAALSVGTLHAPLSPMRL